MKKERFYIGNSVIPKLLLIEMVFILFAVLVAYNTEGIFIQFFIFYSWLVLPIFYLKYFANSPDTVHFGVIIYFLLIPMIHFILSLMLVDLIQKSKINKNCLVFVIVFFLVGVLFCMILSQQEGWLFYTSDPTNRMLLFGSVIIASIFVILYWRIFFQIKIMNELMIKKGLK